MIGKGIKWLLICILVVALWKYFGGDIGAALSAVWNWLSKIVNQASDFLLSTGLFKAILNG
jgi:hypothetical protein